MSITKLTVTTEGYPEIFRQLPQVPDSVWAAGSIELLSPDIPKVAIVGTRKVTPYGRDVTMRLSRELASNGVVIVSGLALGVDSIAHRACLEVGGQTLAVLPSAIDRIYPRTHTQLAGDIAAHGLLLSEYSPGSPTPMKYQFIARNRLIAALADVIVVPEAALKSGSLHTAQFGLELGKNVMAVPGAITNPLSEGTNNLIKNGAGLVTDVSDVLLALGMSKKAVVPKDTSLSPDELLIVAAIQKGVRDMKGLLDITRLSPATLNQTLSILEITGKIRALGSTTWALA